VANRVNAVPLVERLVGQHPFFGRGGGSYIAANAFEIFDNEYFKTSVELGLLGLCALLAFYLAPVIAALSARRRSEDLQVRTLCGALAGAGAAAVVCSATFDAMSFPMFVGTEALVAGLSACLWRLTTKAPNAPTPRRAA
jgi:O-antigen ligase